MARIERQWQAEHEGTALASELHKVMVISHRQAKGFIDGHCVTVNGEVVDKHGLRLKVGDTLLVAFDPERTYDVLPAARKLQSGPYETLWEDNHLMFVFKPAGLLTVPAEQGSEPSLAEAITESYRRRGFKRFNLFIVHRLDRFTSGVLVFAKTPEAVHGLKKLFELHRLQRIYCAVLVGELPENSGTLAGHLIEHAKSLKMSVATARKGPGGGKRMPPGAKEAVTHYRVIERLPGHTVVEVKLETGRRNQIRVQFADRGYPLLGDQVYGVESPLLDRQALHAELLGFKHPVTEDQVTVTAPMPADMEAALKALRNMARLTRATVGETGEEGIFKPAETRDHKLKRAARARRFEDTGTPASGPGRPYSSDRPARPRSADSADRPKRPYSADRPTRPRREDGDERPKRTFGAADRPARPRSADSDERPKRPYSADRPDRPRREDGDERPKRTFGAGDRPSRPRSADSDERPKRPYSADRPDRPRREDGDERPKRTFGAADRPSRPRSADSDERPKRPYSADRPARPRREDGEARPKRTFGSAERPSRPRSADSDERPKRPYAADRPDRPRREDGEARPKRTFGSADRPSRPRSADSDERPKRPYSADRPDRPRREDGEARPKRTFGSAERPSRPRSAEGDDRPRTPRPPGAAPRHGAGAPAGDRPKRPFTGGPAGRPTRKPAPRPGKGKPRKP